jgi:hypothetical protein
MKKLLLVAAILCAGIASADVTNNVVYVTTTNVVTVTAANVTVNPTTGITLATDAENVRVVEYAFNGAVRTASCTRAQEIWIPVGLAIDVGNGTESSVTTVSYLPTGGSTAYRLQAITMVGGSETYTPLANYPSLVYGDSLILAPAASTTTNSYSVTFVKKVIPR